MVTEGLEVAEPFGMRTGGILKGARDAPVKLGPVREKQVVIDDLVHERVSEPIAAVLALGPERLDEVGCNESIEPGLSRTGGQSATARRRVLLELGPDDRGVLQQAPGLGGQPVDAGEEQPLQCGWHVPASKAAVHVQ